MARRTSTTGAPVGRWRARRQETPSSRSGRTLRERRRAARAHGQGGGSTRPTDRSPHPDHARVAFLILPRPSAIDAASAMMVLHA